MPRILVRSHKNPFTVADAETTRASNLIGSNTGNLVFSQAAFRLLSTPETELSTSGVANSKPSHIDDQFDHVVIPLANAFRPKYVNTLKALTHVISKVKVPVTVVGVGAQADLEGEQDAAHLVDPVTQRFVATVLDHSPSIGVRGEFTRDYLRGLGFGDEHVKVIGCPSMFMYGPDLRIDRKVDALTTESPIAFNVSPYVREIGPISLDHAQRYPNLMYMGQNMQTLTLMLDGKYPGRYARMSKHDVPVSLKHPLIRDNRVRFFLDPKTWFSHLAQYDFSFGTRIHGNIAALLAGTPAVLLAHDSRTLELADYHQIPHRVINSLPAKPDAAALYDEADWSKLNDGHAARWTEFSAFLHEHDLTHVYDEGQNASRFDDKLAATEFAPPVETLMGLPPEGLYAMKRSMDELRDELHQAKKEHKTLQQRVGTPHTLQRRLKKKLRRLLKR